MSATAPPAPAPEPAAATDAPAATSLSQWQLISRRFARHRLAMAALYVLGIFYVLAIFSGFFTPYTNTSRDLGHGYCPPQLIEVDLAHGLHATALHRQVDPVTFEIFYVSDETRVVPLSFLVRGEEYRLLGLIPTSWHFFGVDEDEHRELYPEATDTPRWYFLGADKYGHDVASRILHGARISLFIGILAIVLTFVLGVTIGGISGYVGGTVDNLIQRGIEIVNCFPRLPMWIALAAIMPGDWSPLRIYFAITIVLALLNWTQLARQVRGKILSLREEDYAVAARLLGASHGRIILVHLIPGLLSHILVVLTLSVPVMILAETMLSFLGLGLRPPIVSWGVMLQDCMDMQTVATYPWLLLPTLPIVLTVLSFNFLGDGLRDAADPYSTK